MGEVSRERVRAAVQFVAALGEAIRAAGTDGIPSGHLYALVMSTGRSLADYEGAIGVLKRAGVVEERAHLLTWVGPALAEVAS